MLSVPFLCVHRRSLSASVDCTADIVRWRSLAGRRVGELRLRVAQLRDRLARLAKRIELAGVDSPGG